MTVMPTIAKGTKVKFKSDELKKISSKTMDYWVWHNINFYHEFEVVQSNIGWVRIKALQEKNKIDFTFHPSSFEEIPA